MTTPTTDTTQAAIALALEWSLMHETKAADEPEGSQQRKFHRMAMVALDKAIDEMSKGNTPRRVADYTYMVESRTNAGKVYRVNVSSNTCNGDKCFNQCWHLSAAHAMYEAGEPETKNEAADRLARFVAEHGDMQIVDDAFRLDKDIVDLDDDEPNPRYDPIPTESLWDQAQRYQ